MPLPLGPAALAALRVISAAKAARTTGGIVGAGSKSVNPVYKNMTETIQSNSVKVTKTQAQINAEGLKKVREALNLPEKGTSAAVKISSQIKKDSASSSEKAGKASTKISKKTYKK
jgi:hypothetical protein